MNVISTGFKRSIARTLNALAWCWLLAAPGALSAAPPTIVSVDPHPANWLVDGSALDTITVTFDSDVVIPNGAVTAWTIDGGPLETDVNPLGMLTSSVTITIPPIQNNRVTLVLDYSILDAKGVALDGEIEFPRNPLLPSGDGDEGGQAVFQFSVLQGDVNRNGVVDSTDLALMHAAFNSYNPNADLNGDGEITQQDLDVMMANAGSFIPKTDKVPPFVLAVTPFTIPLAAGSVFVTFSEPVDQGTLNPRSVHLVGENGEMLCASGPPIRINDARFEFPFANIACAQNYALKVSNAISDITGELLTPTVHSLFGQDTTPPQLTCPEPTFINSTDPFSVRLEDIPTLPAVQSFLVAAVAADECTPSSDIEMHTSLDTPDAPLPLGVNEVLFTAVDDSGNASFCEGVLIVVPAVPLEGSEGQQGPVGPPGADGADGQDGTNGQNGVNGQDGSSGDPPAGSPNPSSRRLCGALGMVNFMLMFTGLTALRSSHRRRS
jgi:hypothetical protein